MIYIINIRFALTMYCSKLTNQTNQTMESLSSVENVPSPDQCWLQCIGVLKSFADGSIRMGNEVGSSLMD